MQLTPLFIQCNISDYETCKNEAIEFYKSKNIIKDENI